MKIFYSDRKNQFRHFSDLSVLNGMKAEKSCELYVPAQENFVLQFILLPEEETIVSSVYLKGEMEAVCINTQGVDKFGRDFTQKICLRKGHIQPVFLILKADADHVGKVYHCPKCGFVFEA